MGRALGSAAAALALLAATLAVPRARAAESVDTSRPTNADVIRECLATGPVRLRTAFGAIEMREVAWSDSGLACTPLLRSPQWPDGRLFLHWRDVSAIDAMTRTPRSEAVQRGRYVGFGVGFVTLFALSQRRQNSAGRAFALPACVVGALPFALAGGAIAEWTAGAGVGWRVCTRLRFAPAAEHAREGAPRPGS